MEKGRHVAAEGRNGIRAIRGKEIPLSDGVVSLGRALVLLEEGNVRTKQIRESESNPCSVIQNAGVSSELARMSGSTVQRISWKLG